jgi:uncharacterized membrane protein YphA (DoxX/SURF4 family)
MPRKGNIAKILRLKIIQVGCQFLLGGIFIYASLGKILSPEPFLIAIRDFRILPEYLIKPVGYIIPWIEITFGVFLAIGIKPRFSSGVLSIMLVIFILVIASALIRGIDINCGCFIQKLVESQDSYHIRDGLFLILRDILFLLPGAIILFSKQK